MMVWHYEDKFHVGDNNPVTINWILTNCIISDDNPLIAYLEFGLMQALFADEVEPSYGEEEVQYDPSMLRPEEMPDF
ncbi:hypothetical protein H4R21_001577 [Coemansia helicoidea]|uniref:Uncharacterized protein n=1 Tax=Coemansia helicoidea TaxID=1286919 RepID=A0ACC1LC96_9FUNG|nr:hypothetical protein H4R21_001577 [Coemansia helicoidea]